MLNADAAEALDALPSACSLAAGDASGTRDAVSFFERATASADGVAVAVNGCEITDGNTQMPPASSMDVQQTAAAAIAVRAA